MNRDRPIVEEELTLDNSCQLVASRERYVDRSGSLFHDILVIYFQGKVVQFPTKKERCTNNSDWY